MTNYIVGTVGSSLAAQFMMFYNNYSNALSSKDVEKLIKKEIAAAKRKGNVNPEEISETISEIISNLDAVQRGEFAETFIKKYIDNDNVDDAMPLLVFMYALPLESLSAILKTIQTDNIDNYTQLAILDKEANEKGLFKKLVANLKGI
jgi:hypothetical protein